MIKVVNEISLGEFEGWGGGEDVIEAAKWEGKIVELDRLAEEEFSDGVSENGLNDWLRFESEQILSSLGIEEDGEEDEDEE